MDKIDYTILSELTKNSTKTFLEIAKKMGISPTTVQKRYEKMKKDGIILGASTMIDLSLLGYKGKAFLFIKYSKGVNPSFKKNVMQIPNLFLFADIIGEFDGLAMMVYRDNSEIKDTSDKIRAISCVKQVKIAITTDTFYPVKEEYLDSITKLFKE
jgi:DNA-binding Lrp family transcriptional regulator